MYKYIYKRARKKQIGGGNLLEIRYFVLSSCTDFLPVVNKLKIEASWSAC